MAQSWTSSTDLPRRRHVGIALMTLLRLAVTINSENLDAAVDPDIQTTDEFTVENSAGSYGTSPINLT